jgi:hypothetical protein
MTSLDVRAQMVAGLIVVGGQSRSAIHQTASQVSAVDVVRNKSCLAGGKPVRPSASAKRAALATPARKVSVHRSQGNLALSEDWNAF